MKKLNFFPTEERKTSTSLMTWGWVNYQQKFFLFKKVNYSFKYHAVVCDWVCLNVDGQWETHAVKVKLKSWKTVWNSCCTDLSQKHLTGLIIIRRMSQTVCICVSVWWNAKQCLPEICFKTGLKLRVLGETEIERQVPHLSTRNTLPFLHIWRKRKLMFVLKRQ